MRSYRNLISMVVVLIYGTILFAQPLITVDPDAYEFDMEQEEILEFILSIANDGDAVLEYNILLIGNFLSGDDGEGRLEEGEDIDIELEASTVNAAFGAHEGRIVILSNAMEEQERFVDIVVWVTGGEDPFRIEPNRIELEPIGNGVPNVVELTCFNDGDAVLTVEAIDPLRQIFYVEDGVLPLDIEAGGEAVLEVSYLVEEAGVVAASPLGIEFSIDELRGSKVVQVDEFEVLQLGPFVSDQTEINLQIMEGQEGDFNLTLSNQGEMDIDWHIELPEIYDWLSIEPIEGLTQPQENSALNVSVNTNNLIEGIHQAEFAIENSTTKDITVVISLDVLTSVSNENDPILRQFKLYHPYPNPFNSTTNIRYTIPTAGKVNVGVYNTNGELVITLMSGWNGAGAHAVEWEAGGDISGIYFVMVEGEWGSQIRKVVLVR